MKQKLINILKETYDSSENNHLQDEQAAEQIAQLICDRECEILFQFYMGICGGDRGTAKRNTKMHAVERGFTAEQIEKSLEKLK